MRNQQDDPYLAKAYFFDAQVQADWAAQDYGGDEVKKLDRLFAITGCLTGLRLLEPGCGTGRLTEVLAEKVGPRGQVVAMDISPRMVAAARQRLIGFTNVDLRLGSVEEMADQQGIFDQVICHQVFPHFVDQAVCPSPGPAGVRADHQQHNTDEKAGNQKHRRHQNMPGHLILGACPLEKHHRPQHRLNTPAKLSIP